MLLYQVIYQETFQYSQKNLIDISISNDFYTPRNEVRGGILDSACLSVCLSVCPSVRLSVR